MKRKFLILKIIYIFRIRYDSLNFIIKNKNIISNFWNFDYVL